MADQPRKILIVDDDVDLRLALSAVFEEAGYRVEVAPNGASAMQAITQAPPDLILLDLMMANGNGWDVLEMLRSTPPLSRLPVVVVSAYASSVPNGAQALLRKPVRREALLAAVSHHVPQALVEASPRMP